MSPTRLVVLFVVLLCLAHLPEACLNEWCWQPSFGMQQHFVSLTNRTRDAAVIFCAGHQATLAAPTTSAKLALENASSSAIAWSSGIVNDTRVEFVDGPADDLVGWNPRAGVPLYDCFAVQTYIGVMSVNCTTARIATICTRTIEPASWASIDTYALEYGLYDVRLPKADARTFCRDLGSADTAYLPQPQVSALLSVIQPMRHSDTLPSAWIGHDPVLYNHGRLWDNDFTVGELPWDPTDYPTDGSSPSRTGDLCTYWNIVNNTFTNTTCFLKLPVLCARFAMPSTREFCDPEAGDDLAYQFLPLKPKNSSDHHSGYYISQGIAECAAAGGNVTKFTNTNGLLTCFSKPALYSVGVPIANSVWMDGSVTPVSGVMTNPTSPCTRTEGIDSTSVGVIKNMNCDKIIPMVCEFDTTRRITFTVSSSVLRITQSCPAAISITLKHGIPANSWYSVCPLTTPSMLVISCAVFSSDNATSTGYVSVRSTSATVTAPQSVQLHATCSPSSLCSGVVNVAVAVTTVAQMLPVVSVDGVVVTAPFAAVAAVGQTATVTLQAPPAIATNNGGVIVDFTVANGQNADGCRAWPATVTINASVQSASVRVACDYAPGRESANFSLVANFHGITTGCMPHPAATGSWRIIDFTTIPRQTVVVERPTSPAEALPFYAFGETNRVPIRFSKLPSAFRGSYVCVGMEWSSLPSIVMQPACIHPLSASTLADIIVWTTSVTAAADFTAVMRVYGPAATQFVNETFALDFALAFFPLNVTGLEAVEYLGDNVTITLTVPYAVPSTETLTVSANPNVQPGCTPMNAQGVPAGALSSATSYTLRFVPTEACLGRGNVTIEIFGTLNRFFRVNFVSPYVFDIRRGKAIVVTPRLANVYVGAVPVALNVTLPEAFTSTDAVFSMSISYSGKTVSDYITADVSTMTFVSGGPQYAIMHWTAVKPGAGIVIRFAADGVDNTAQFSPPDEFTVSVRDRSNLTVSVPTEPFYFSTAWYTATVIFAVPPLTPGDALTVRLVDANVVSEYFNLTSAYPTLQGTFRFKVVGADAGVVLRPTVSMTGSASYAYRLATPSVILPAVEPQITVTMSAPYFLLTSESSAACDGCSITFSVSKPPRASERLVVTITTSSSLSVAQSQLTWLLGNSRPITVQLLPREPDEAAQINFTVVSYAYNDVISEEANATQRSNQTWVLVIRRKGTIVVSSWQNMERALTSTLSYPLQVDRDVRVNVTITQPPSLGTYLLIEPVLREVPQSAVTLDPPNATFTSDSRRWVVIRFRGAIAQSQVTRVTFTATGTATSQFDSDLSVTHQLLVVAREPIVCDLPPVVVAGANPVDIAFRVGLLPTFNMVVQLRAQPNIVVFQPAFVTWNSTTSTQQTVKISALQPSLTQVEIFAEPPPLSGFSAFSGSLSSAEPSNVTVVFPTERTYFGEAAKVTVSIGTSVVGAVSLVVAGVVLDCTSCSAGTTLVFSGTTKSRDFNVYYQGNAAVQAPVVASVRVKVDDTSTAATQYRFDSKYEGAVTFLPLRRVLVLTVPNPFYLATEDDIWLTITENPDAGAWVSIEASSATTSAMWTGTANTSAIPGPRNLRMKFAREGYANVTFTVKASDPTQRNRYATTNDILVRVIRKVSVAADVTNFRSKQVIGDENAQLLRVELSRLPQRNVNATPVFKSPLGDIVAFAPAQLEWTVNDTTLVRYIRVTGVRRGEITDFALALSADLPEELAYTVSPTIASSLIFEQYHTLSFTGARESAYIDGSHDRSVNVSISAAGFFPVTVALNFSALNAVRFDSTLVTFRANDPVLWREVHYQCLLPTIDGGIIVTKVSGNEFSSTISGEVSFSIFSRIRAATFIDQVEITPAARVSLLTDEATTFAVEVDGFHSASEGGTATYTLQMTPVGTAPTPSFVVITPTVLNFTRITRRQTFSVLTGSLQPFSFNVTLTAPAERKYAPGYTLAFFTNVSVRIGVADFPQRIFVGASNTAYFSVFPLTEVANRDFLQLTVVAQCDGIASVMPDSALDWNAGVTTPVAIRVQGISTGTCRVVVRRAGDAIREDVSTYFTGEFVVIQPAYMEWSNRTLEKEDTTTWTKPLTIEFRRFRDVGATVYVQTFETYEAVLSENLNYTALGSGESLTAPASFVIRSDKSLDDEPRGFIAQHRRGGCSPLTITRADGRGLLAFRFGPCSEVIELEGETLAIEATALAFDNIAPRRTNASLQVYIPEYIPSIVTKPVETATVTLSSLAAAGSFLYAAPFTMQPARALAFLGLFECPNKNWVDLQAELSWMDTFTPNTVYFSSLENLGRWLFVAVTNTAILLFVAGIHLFACASWYISRNSDSKRTFAETCGRLRFPALTVVFTSIWMLPTVNAATRVMIYSPNSDYQVYGGLLLVIPVLVIPISLHRLLWGNSTLVYTMSDSKQTWIKYTALRIMRPEGYWTHPHPSFMGRYGALFQEQRGNHRWFYLFEYVATVVIAMLTAIEPSVTRGCVAKAATVTAVVGIETLALILWRPFVRTFTNVALSLGFTIQLVALIIITSELSKRIRNDTLQAFAVGLLVTAATIFLITGLWYVIASLGQVIGKKAGIAKNKTQNPANDSPTRDSKRPSLFVPALEAPLVQPRLGAVAERGAAVDDLSDDDLDVEALKAVEVVAKQSVQPRGVFRSRLRGGEVAFSPLRRQALDDRRRIATEPSHQFEKSTSSADEDDGDVALAVPAVAGSHAGSSSRSQDAEHVHRAPYRFVVHSPAIDPDSL
jgi:hypothetical protein